MNEIIITLLTIIGIGSIFLVGLICGILAVVNFLKGIISGIRKGGKE